MNSKEFSLTTLISSFKSSLKLEVLCMKQTKNRENYIIYFTFNKYRRDRGRKGNFNRKIRKYWLRQHEDMFRSW